MNTDRFKFRVWSPTKKIFISLPWYGRFHNSQLEVDEHDCYSDNDEDMPIIEQCTGLRDKNGKLIYEGDVIKNPNYPSLWFVVWMVDNARFEKLRVSNYRQMKEDFPRKSEAWILKNTSSSILGADIESVYNEVVGNIHEAKWGIK